MSANPTIPVNCALLAFLVTTTFGAPSFTLRGTITDASTGEPLPAATVRIAGTSRGTIANSDGEYSIAIDDGQYQVIFSSLGYRPDTVAVTLHDSGTRDIRLTPVEILLPEVVVTSENPAYGIIRQAIAAKKRWNDLLTTYTMDAFTRQRLMRDTAIASITESYTKGYWQRGDTLREVVVQRRQTDNLKPDVNVASVGRILNFYDEEVRFIGYAFVGPVADDALSYYDVKLLDTRAASGQTIHDIALIPRTETTPLFHGTVSIAGDSWALVGVDVEPNEAFLLPFITTERLRYRQQFGLYENRYWMPADIRVDAAFTIGVMGLTFPRMQFSQTSVIYDYAINVPLPDSMFRKPTLVIDTTAARYDSSFWSQHEVLPLNAQEEEAYATLDSTRTLDVQFRPRGLAVTLGSGENGEDGPLQQVFRHLDLSYNRVEGLSVGVRADLDHILPWLDLKGTIGYGLSDKLTTFSAGGVVRPLPAGPLRVGADVYRCVAHSPDGGYYGALFNSFTALLLKNDYRDYFRADGWSAQATISFPSEITLGASFMSEDERSMSARTDFSIFNKRNSFRENPVIDDGRVRSVTVAIRAGETNVPLDYVAANTIGFSVERSLPGAGSDFSFTRFSADGTLVVPTFGRSYLFPAEIRVRMAGGFSRGELPVQRVFSLESSLAGYGPFGVMRTLGVRALRGTASLAITLEHNFRSLPFLALDIPFLYRNNIELVVHGGAGKVWRALPPTESTDPVHVEAGVGINRILELFRVDCTWKLKNGSGVWVTLSAAHLI